MSPTFYSILHVFSVVVLTGFTFAAFANPIPEKRKKIMMITGIASLVALIAGFGLISKVLANTFPAWVFVKIGAWLALSALAGIAFRRPNKTGLLTVIALVTIFVALYAVYARPV